MFFNQSECRNCCLNLSFRKSRHKPNLENTSKYEHMGILSTDARDEWNKFCVRRHLFERVHAASGFFKRAIYVARKILSREMKDYNKFTHISNTVDIHSVCRDFE